MFNLPIGLIIVIVIGVIYFFNSAEIKNYISNFTNSDYKNVSLSTLISYSNFNDKKNVCTEGFHIKSKGLTVLKESVDKDLYNNSVWLRFDGEKESFFESFFPEGKSAEVKLCGYFESKIGEGFGTVGYISNQITVNEYELLSNPQTY